MSDVVMKEEDSDTLSVKELDVVLPRYQPINGYKSPLDFILPPYQEFPGSSNYAGVSEPTPQEPIPIKEAEAELENLHLPSSEEEDFDAVLPMDLMISPVISPISIPVLDFSVYDQFSPLLEVTYSPTSPGGHLFCPTTALLMLCTRSLCSAPKWNSLLQSRKGTNFERSRSAVPDVAEHTGLLTLRARDLAREEEEKKESGFDTLSVDELFKGHMPDWLPDDSKLQCYEMKESEVEQAKGWLQLYAELAWYTKKQTDPYMFEYGKPFELLKIVVQTKDVVDSMENLKLDDAVFYITFRTRCGVACKGVIRRTRDGRPEHLSLEAKCFV
ncbi:hypothetical protein Bca52824_024978 [Brassica carinata]|uniref:Uncharacterized protein n=2 Tax=Brassica carinata TaxID=52824 RepID=A0A8X7VLD9_BRACI|nr:hypothetical protein Bca52824_024978 [Brassica carinata]